jgi:chaperonin GroES
VYLRQSPETPENEYPSINDFVIVRRQEEAHVSRGGILIHDSATEKPVKGEVLAVGNGRILKDGNVLSPEVAAGDRVLLGKYAGTEIRLEGEELLVMHETDIMAVLE